MPVLPSGDDTSEHVIEVEADKEVVKKGKFQGSIKVKFYENGWDTEFDGDIKGRDVQKSFGFINKGYRRWQSSKIDKKTGTLK